MTAVYSALSQCISKVPFVSRRSALIASKRQNLQVYKCPHCMAYHIGHKIATKGHKAK